MRIHAPLVGLLTLPVASTRVAVHRLMAAVELPFGAECIAKLSHPNTRFLSRLACAVLLSGALAIWIGMSLRVAAYRDR